MHLPLLVFAGACITACLSGPRHGPAAVSESVQPESVAVQANQDQPDPVTSVPDSTSLGISRSLKWSGLFLPQANQAEARTKLSKVVLYGLQLTFYEHVMRVATQEFTREQLKGPFWADYLASVHVPQQWRDKDHWQVNDIGHAISGGAFVRIWMEQREAKGGTPSQYLASMTRGLVFAAIFSIQYEIGPMSEASIGNVGLNPNDLGWSDYIWTPIGGLLWTMGEDAIDKYALTYLDRHLPFKMARVAARMILNPSRMLANIGQNRAPWSRSDRTIDGEPIRR